MPFYALNFLENRSDEEDYEGNGRGDQNTVYFRNTSTNTHRHEANGGMCSLAFHFSLKRKNFMVSMQIKKYQKHKKIRSYKLCSQSVFVGIQNEMVGSLRFYVEVVKL